MPVDNNVLIYIELIFEKKLIVPQDGFVKSWVLSNIVGILAGFLANFVRIEIGSLSVEFLLPSY